MLAYVGGGSPGGTSKLWCELDGQTCLAKCIAWCHIAMSELVSGGLWSARVIAGLNFKSLLQLKWFLASVF